MSYYGPEFANISSGWYLTTTRPNYAPVRRTVDALWSARWDSVVEQLVSEYGTFYTAFLQDMQGRFERENSLEPGSLRYFEYYAETRAWSLPGIRATWLKAHRRAEGQKLMCQTCGDVHKMVDIHPMVIRSEWPRVVHCYACYWILRTWERHGVRTGGPALHAAIEKVRHSDETCVACGQVEQENVPLSSVAAFEEMAYWLWINASLRLCRSCHTEIFGDNASGGRAAQLRRLRNFVRYLGKIPQQEFHPLVYSSQDRRDMLLLLAHVRKLRDSAGYKKEYGSFLAALIAADLLPAGTRKMTIGTMVLADDGHVCLSRAEKNIDDWLTRNRVSHSKEVRYPGCGYRADWAVTTGGLTFFIEYLGLAGHPDYDRKTERKRKVAADNGIELIGILPNDRWMTTLSERLSLTDAPNKSLKLPP